MNRTPREAERNAAALCIVLTLAGCMQPAGWNSQPFARPPQPIGGISQPRPHYGYRPITPIGYAPFPVVPGVPVVMNPLPPSGMTPSPPSVPPGSTPTDPITHPNPSPDEPPAGYDKAWSPWPLPPQRKLVATRQSAPSINTTYRLAHGVLSNASQFQPARSQNQLRLASYTQSDPFDTASSDRTLKYRGGHLIRDLRYVNLYVSGNSAWTQSDIDKIERSLAAALGDEHLNNVLRQYFQNEPITATRLAPHPLVGYVPQQVTRGDIENYVLHLDQRGYLRNYNFRTTVFNLLLPQGTVLSDSFVASHTSGKSLGSTNGGRGSNQDGPTQSTEGLAGYHGSVTPDDGRRIYFSVSTYSNRSSNGSINGIPVFPEAWKNVVATLYHQLMEVRTDPDVEDALRHSADLDSDQILGWVSDSGLEIGDVFGDSTLPIESIIREVPLSDGTGYVPVQLPYSNAANGIEGPIARPHTL